MIDRRSLQFGLAWRLAALLILVSVAVVAGLWFHAGRIEGAHPSNLVHSVMLEFFVDMAWTIPVVVVAATVIGVLAIRRGLRHLREASQRASEIGPGSEKRLSPDTLPSEIRPLAEAVNKAFDRLQDGYEAQRRFTANAAHELRTPLALLTAGVERAKTAGVADLSSIEEDIDRMARIVGQLLALARVESLPLTETATIDIGFAARDISAAIAPLALKSGVRLAIEAPDTPVMVSGDLGSVEEMLRNVIENAIAHAPGGSEVVVSVRSDGEVRVDDRGPGIPADSRAKAFERFWRGPWSTAKGSGLGLSIVAEAARRIAARVDILDNPGGGARIRLAFRSV